VRLVRARRLKVFVGAKRDVRCGQFLPGRLGRAARERLDVGKKCADFSRRGLALAAG
jgi:hypothetical protein